MAELEFRSDGRPSTESVFRVDGDTGPDLEVFVTDVDLSGGGTSNLNLQKQDTGKELTPIAGVVSGASSAGSTITFTFLSGVLAEGTYDLDVETTTAGSVIQSFPRLNKTLLLVRKAVSTPG